MELVLDSSIIVHFCQSFYYSQENVERQWQNIHESFFFSSTFAILPMFEKKEKLFSPFDMCSCTSMTKNFWLFFFEKEPNKDRYSTFLHSATLLLCWARMWFLNAFNLCLQFQKEIVSLKYYEILCIVVDGSNSSTTIQSLKKEAILRKQRNRGCRMRNFLLASCFNR